MVDSLLLKVLPTEERLEVKNDYMMKLSKNNMKKLRLSNRKYALLINPKPFKINNEKHYFKIQGQAFVDNRLDDKSIMVDQTLRDAIGIKKYEEEKEKGEVIVKKSLIHGCGIFSKIGGVQYLICRVKRSRIIDAEKPITRLDKSSMSILGVEDGDFIIIEGQNFNKKIRVFELTEELINERKKDEEERPDYYINCEKRKNLSEDLPLLFIDYTLRKQLNLKICDPVRVRRSSRQALSKLFSELSLLLVLTMIGASFNMSSRWGIIFISIGFILAVLLVLYKLRSTVV